MSERTKLNRLPVLDHGYVSLMSCSPSYSDHLEIRSSMFRNRLTSQAIDMIYVHLQVKCPYFILIPMVSSGIRCTSSVSQASDAFCPTVDMIASGSTANDRDISESMKMTVESLMLNQKSYVHDGCNAFVASVTTPVSAYWEGVMYASMGEWSRFMFAKDLHPIVKQYQRAVHDAVSIEYKNLEDIKRFIQR
jgi:hypothetical protein